MITLYIKTHNITGLKYFGTTTAVDPAKYNGSGKYWIRHLRKHGNDVSTIIYKQYDCVCEELIIDALAFSEENNIVNSNEWANLIPENGYDGGTTGCAVYIDEHGNNILINVEEAKARNLIAESKGRRYSSDVNNKKSCPGELNGMYGKIHSDDAKKKQGLKSKDTITCFDIDEKMMKRIPKEEFYKLKNIKYVGPTSKLTKEYYENKKN